MRAAANCTKMANVASETWVGTNGSSWPAQWTTYFGTATIQGNSGQIVNPAGGTYNGSYANLTGMADQGDTELLMSFAGTAAGVEQSLYLAIDVNRTTVISNGSSPDGYYLQINYATAAASSSIQLVNSTTQLGSTVTKSLTGTTSYTMRFQRLGSVLRARIWTTGSVEPAAWDITYTGTLTRTGIVQLTSSNGSNATSRTFIYDNLTVYNSTAQLPYTETWDTNIDNTAWPSVWTQSGNGSLLIQANAGQITTPAAGYIGTRGDFTSLAPLSDTDVSGTVIGVSTGVEQFVQIGVNGDATGSGPFTGYYAPNNGYYMAIAYAATIPSSTLQLVSSINATETILVTSATRSINPSIKYGFRFQRVGQVLNGRLWDASLAEPSAWDITYNMGNGALLTGVPFLGPQNGATTGARTFMFDSYVVSNMITSVPIAWFRI